MEQQNNSWKNLPYNALFYIDKYFFFKEVKNTYIPNDIDEDNIIIKDSFSKTALLINGVLNMDFNKTNDPQEGREATEEYPIIAFNFKYKDDKTSQIFDGIHFRINAYEKNDKFSERKIFFGDGDDAKFTDDYYKTFKLKDIKKLNYIVDDIEEEFASELMER